MKRKTPKVEAWAVVPDGSAPTDFFLSRMTAKQVADDKAWPAEVVRLVPADPDKERVVRAAMQWARAIQELDDYSGPVDEPLMAAVEKLPKGRRK